MDEASKLGMVWCIEYLASLKEIDSSIIRGLIAEAPEVLEDLGENTEELIALRSLEDLFRCRNQAFSNVPSAEKPKITLDISRSCEDVLVSILEESSRTGADLLEWDMQPFIAHKRSNMPKCHLQRLKDQLLEGSHPCTASLIGHSGLLIENTEASNSVIMAGEESTVSLPLEHGDSHHQNLSPVERNQNVMDNENEADYPKDRIDVSDGDLCLNVSSANEPVEHTLSPQFDNELVEESLKRVIETTEKEAERESQVEGLGECVSSENGQK